MIKRSVRPGHSDTNATEPLLARAIRLRATRPRISVEIRLRCATDTPCLGWERFFPNPFNPETPPRHHLERSESAPSGRKVVQNQHLAVIPRSIPPHQGSDSEVRKLPRRPLMRTSESKEPWQFI